MEQGNETGKALAGRYRKKAAVWAGTFLLGALGYCCLEMGWRGCTHWSMGVAGGGCLVGLVYLNRRFIARPVWQQAAVGAALITAVEWCTGCVVNVILGWKVWDYSSLRFQLAGQVSLLFSFFWYLLSFGVFGLWSLVRRPAGQLSGGEGHRADEML